MNPIMLLAAAVAAALAGAALGAWQQHRLSRPPRSWWPWRDDPGYGWLRWLAAAVAGSCAVRFALALEPGIGWALLPLMIAGPWLAAVTMTGLHAPDTILATIAWLTLNGAIVAGAFAGGIGPAFSALLGAGLAGAVFGIAQLLLPDLIGSGEVKLAAVIGLATGTLGLMATGLAVGAGVLSGLLSRGTYRRLPAGPWLLAGAWAAALLLAP